MKNNGFMFKLADLFLQTDKSSKDWMNVPILRRMWRYLFFIVLFIIAFYFVFMVSPLLRFLENSETLTTVFRFTSLALLTATAFISIVLTIQYFRYVLSQSVRINLNNAAFFYLLHVVLFGMFYCIYYTIDQSAFQYPSPPMQIESTVVHNPVQFWLMKMQFIVFSACQSLHVDYFKIVSKSSIVCILGLVQSMYTISLITLVVSSYVAQRLKKKS